MNNIKKHTEFEKKMLKFAFERDSASTDDVASLWESFISEKCVDVAAAINPISHITAPAIIVALETYAERLRKSYPGAGEIADDFRKLSDCKTIKVSMPRRVKLD